MENARITLDTALTRAEISDILESVYTPSFPVEERRPSASIIELAASDESPLTFMAIKAGAKTAGMATAWRFPEALYIEHLAVAPECRDGGIGSAAIRLIGSQSELPLLVEVEPPETSAEAARRIKFYERLGFKTMEAVDYVQPPYAEGLPPVRLLLMATGEIADVARFVRERLYGTVYGVTPERCQAPS